MCVCVCVQLKARSSFFYAVIVENAKRDIFAKIWSCKIASHAKIRGNSIAGNSNEKTFGGRVCFMCLRELDYLLNTQASILLFCKCLFLSNQPVKLLSCVRLFATRWTVAYQAPPSMGFSRQEYWSGVPLPSPGPLLGPDSKGSITRIPIALYKIHVS